MRRTCQTCWKLPSMSLTIPNTIVILIKSGQKKNVSDESNLLIWPVLKYSRCDTWWNKCIKIMSITSHRCESRDVYKEKIEQNNWSLRLVTDLGFRIWVCNNRLVTCKTNIWLYFRIIWFVLSGLGFYGDFICFA